MDGAWHTSDPVPLQAERVQASSPRQAQARQPPPPLPAARPTRRVKAVHAWNVAAGVRVSLDPTQSCPLFMSAQDAGCCCLTCFVSAGGRGRFDLPCRVGDRSDLDATGARLAHRTAGGQDGNLPGELLHGELIESCAQEGPAVFARKQALLGLWRARGCVLEAGTVKGARDSCTRMNKIGPNFILALVLSPSVPPSQSGWQSLLLSPSLQLRQTTDAAEPLP